VETTRVRRLRELLADTFHDSQTEMSKRTGISLSQIGQYFCGYRNIGEKVARKIEVGAGKPSGWLDVPSDAALSSGQLTPYQSPQSPENQWLLDQWQSASDEAKEVARFALASHDAPLPPWADKDMRKDMGYMIHSARCWLDSKPRAVDKPRLSTETRQFAAETPNHESDSAV